jgi:hypothetical protein
LIALEINFSKEAIQRKYGRFGFENLGFTAATSSSARQTFRSIAEIGSRMRGLDEDEMRAVFWIKEKTANEERMYQAQSPIRGDVPTSGSYILYLCQQNPASLKSSLTLNLSSALPADRMGTCGSSFELHRTGKSEADLIFKVRRWCETGMRGKLSLSSCAHSDSSLRRDNNINDHGTRTPPEVA